MKAFESGAYCEWDASKGNFNLISKSNFNALFYPTELLDRIIEEALQKQRLAFSSGTGSTSDDYSETSTNEGNDMVVDYDVNEIANIICEVISKIE